MVTCEAVKQKEAFVVVGAGRVGTAIAMAMKEAGYLCLALFGRDAARLKKSCDLVGVSGYTKIDPAVVKSAEIILIGVPDDQIEGCVVGLHAMGAVPPGGTLIHFSGLVTSEVLAPGGVERCGRASMHPNLAVADPATAAAKMKGTYFGIEGDEQGVRVAQRIVTDIGGRAVEVPSSGKVAYHLAAVFASNGMVVLASMACEILEGIGVPREVAEGIAAKLMLGTAQNLCDLGVLRALTGPVVRGDAKTVSAHLAFLDGMSADAASIYRLLFRRMVRLGLQAGRGTEETYAPIVELLEEA